MFVYLIFIKVANGYATDGSTISIVVDHPVNEQIH